MSRYAPSAVRPVSQAVERPRGGFREAQPRGPWCPSCGSHWTAGLLLLGHMQAGRCGSPEPASTVSRSGFHHRHEGGLQEEGKRAGRRCPGWWETSLLTYQGAATTLRISAWGSRGRGRGPFLSQGPAQPAGWLLGWAGRQLRPQGTGRALPSAPNTHLPEWLPQHLLAVNGAPAREEATVTPGLPAPWGRGQ